MDLDVLVVGSVNVDIVVRVPALPAPGTTVTGGALERHGGGKGANQAVAAARLGARVGVIAAVGDDPDGDEAVATLRREGIDVSGIATRENTATGVALIVVDDQGENQIAVASGANQELDAAMVTAALGGTELAPSGVCLVGFEVSDAAIEVAAQWASAGGHRVVIVPAPARHVTEALIACAPILTLNAGEAADLSGERSPRAAAVALSRRTTRPVAVTLGKSGIVVADGDRVASIPAYETAAKDTTGAGDTFSGALAVGLSESRPFPVAVQRAQAAAALSTRMMGARTGMPTSAELEDFLREASG